MKKKVLIICGVILLIVISLVVIFIPKNTSYVIKYSSVDDRSPDRLLTVYNGKNEKIEFTRIEYLDGVVLCEGYNPTVFFGDIEGEKEFIIVFQDKSTVKAKIVEDEVKK